MKRKIYILLTVYMMLYLFGITIINIFVYGSVIQWNLSILSLAALIPLYLGFKGKNFHKKAIYMMAIYMIVISLVAGLVFPKYTYQDALENFDNHVPSLRKHVGEKSFFYQGDYYIKTDEGNFSFDIHTGDIRGVEDEYK